MQKKGFSKTASKYKTEEVGTFGGKFFMSIANNSVTPEGLILNLFIDDGYPER
jgi:hypothetical protein